ncbi:MAG: LPXTG cell wall anchor domain-containing protein [Clostridium sp.]
MEDSKKDKLPETGKRSLLGYIGAFTIAAGSLLLGKNKKK